MEKCDGHMRVFSSGGSDQWQTMNLTPWEDRATQMLHSWADETLALQNPPLSLWVGVCVPVPWSELLFLSSRKSISVYGVTKQFSSVLSHVAIQLTQETPWKDFSLPIERSWHPCQKPIDTWLYLQAVNSAPLTCMFLWYRHIMSWFSWGWGLIQPTPELTFLKQLL